MTVQPIVQPTNDVAWPSVPDALPATMRAAVFEEFGGPEVLVPATIPTPLAEPGGVVVRVGAVSVGRLLDLSSRAGTHPFASFTLPHVLGAEHAGTVVSVGTGVRRVRVGDAVAVFPAITCGECEVCASGHSEACARMQIFGVHRQGAYAEYTAIPETNVHVLTEKTRAAIGPAAAASLALAGPVSMHQLRIGEVKPGDWVLVQGAASSLGSVTAGLARHLGARVIGTSRSAGKRAVLEGMGLHALDAGADDFVARVLDLTGGRGAAVVIDDLGGPQVFETSTACLATLGTLVTSGAFLGGRVQLDLGRVYLRSQRIVGVRTGTRADIGALWAAVDAGFRPLVGAVYGLDRAADAHRYLEGDAGAGRVLLVPDTTRTGRSPDGSTL